MRRHNIILITFRISQKTITIHTQYYEPMSCKGSRAIYTVDLSSVTITVLAAKHANDLVLYCHSMRFMSETSHNNILIYSTCIHS